MTNENIHAGQPLLTRGPVIEKADGVVVMIHGRGASAESILSLYDALDVPRLAAVAPQARGGTWYPQSFLAPLAMNQPHLDSALARVDAVVTGLLARGVPGEKIALLGFSQGACLTSEYVARHPRRYGGVMALTGGVIGPPGTVRQDEGDLAGTPIFLGTSDPDPHVPIERAEETAAIFRRLGGAVDFRVYPGMPHTINEEEVAACRAILRGM
jgi:phospholipase/carboxylesterase